MHSQYKTESECPGHLPEQFSAHTQSGQHPFHKQLSFGNHYYISHLSWALAGNHITSVVQNATAFYFFFKVFFLFVEMSLLYYFLFFFGRMINPVISRTLGIIFVILYNIYICIIYVVFDSAREQTGNYSCPPPPEACGGVS